MSNAEICAQLNEAFFYLERRALYWIKEDYSAKKLKSRKYPFSKEYTCRTPRTKLDMHVLVSMPTANDSTWSETAFCEYFVEKSGPYIAIKAPWGFTIFPPHFISRYRKRILKGQLPTNEFVGLR